MFSRVVLFVGLASAAMSAQAATVKGTYQEVVSGSCVFSQAGFNSDFSAVLAGGQLTFTFPFTFIGTATFHPKGSGTFAATGMNINTGFVYGSPPSYFFQPGGGTQNRNFAFSVATDGNGNSVLTVTPKANGGITGTTTSGVSAGATYVINNAAAEQGLVGSGDVITMASAGPVVETYLYTLNGVTTPFPAICTETETLTPLR